MSYILIDKENYCFCNCAMTCVCMHKSGMMKRCTKQEIESKGFKTIQVHDKESERQVLDSICIDGYEHTLKIKNVTHDKKRKRGILRFTKIYSILFGRR
jgi:hypothetical protein